MSYFNLDSDATECCNYFNAEITHYAHLHLYTVLVQLYMCNSIYICILCSSEVLRSFVIDNNFRTSIEVNSIKIKHKLFIHRIFSFNIIFNRLFYT